ncbi:MAG: hypothetical protein ACXWE7_11925, partial [Nitrososphaeraceae archaeon]
KKGLKRNDYQWSAVIFDDGAVSGKHLRELKTYLQGLGAEHVFTLVFLDRTGQPAQEKILKKFLWQNRRFWRWDVPALGNQRDCLLCQGLAIVETFSHDLHSPTQKERLTKWLAQWEVRDVETQWNDNPRLLQTPDMHGLTITFGVNKEKSWGEKTLTPNDSSSATAILMELTRLTTRADVVMKKVRWLEKKYRSEEQETLLDIAMEMIASQLLLYLDELSLQEQKQRLKTMLSLIWERPNANNATILGGLCFTFVDKKIIEELWSYCLTSLLKVKRLGNFDAILAVNILCSRHEFITKTKYLPSGNIGSIESDNYIMLARGTVQKKVRDVLSQYLIVLHRNISGYHENTHKSEIKIRLSSLIDADEADNLDTQIAEILTDLDKINKILDDLEAVSLDHFNKNDRDILSTLVFDLNRENKKIDEDKNITSISSKIMEFLYGSGTKNGFIDQLSKKLFIACAIDSFDRDFFRTIRLDVLNTNRWNEIVKAKNKKNELKGEMLCWVDKDGEKIIQPKVEYSDNNQKDSLWFYCDKYVTCVLDETLSNVYHTELDIPNAQTNNEYYQHKEINNPFIETPSEKTAHLWWHVKRENDHVVIETANACNKKAVLRPSVNRSRLENAGGKVELVIIKNIAYATVKIPLFSLFVEER